jgi:hypothetical protein
MLRGELVWASLAIQGDDQFVRIKVNQMMSSRRCKGFSEGKNAVLLNRILEPLFPHGLFHDVHLAIQEIRKTILQFFKTGKVIEASARKCGVQANRYIDIGFRNGFVTSCRTENRKTRDTSRA